MSIAFTICKPTITVKTMASNATITPTKVSNDTTDSFMLPNIHSPQIDNTPTKEISDKIKIIFVFILI
jgi:hypothetical protein